MRISIKNGAVFSTSYIFLAIVAVSHAFVYWIPVWKSTSPSHHNSRIYNSRHQFHSAWKWKPVKLSRPSLYNLNHHHPLCPLCHVAHYWNKKPRGGGIRGGGGGGKHHHKFFHTPHHNHHHHHHPHHHHHHHSSKHLHDFAPSRIFPKFHHHHHHHHHGSNFPKLKAPLHHHAPSHHHQNTPEDGFMGPHHSFAKFKEFPKFGHFPKGMDDLPKFSPGKLHPAPPSGYDGGQLSHVNNEPHHHTPLNYHSSNKFHNLDYHNRHHHHHHPQIRGNFNPQTLYYRDPITQAHFPVDNHNRLHNSGNFHHPEEQEPSSSEHAPAKYPEKIINPAEIIREISHSPVVTSPGQAIPLTGAAVVAAAGGGDGSSEGAPTKDAQDDQEEGPEFPKEFSNFKFGGEFAKGKKGQGWGGWDW